MFYLLETSSPSCYQDHVKISFQTGKGKKPENILNFDEKNGKNPDWGKNRKISGFYIKIIICGKGISRENPKFEHVNQSIYTDHERMPRISTGKPIHYSHKSNIREKSLLSNGNDCERMPRI